MEKNNLKKVEKELKDIKIFIIAQVRLQKEMLMELKQFRRDMKKLGEFIGNVEEEQKSQL